MNEYPAGTVLVAQRDNAHYVPIRKGQTITSTGDGRGTLNQPPEFGVLGTRWHLPEEGTFTEDFVPASKAEVTPRYVVRLGEEWVGRGHPNTRKVGKVTAVRVRKGDPSGRGGQFHGATNYGEVNA